MYETGHNFNTEEIRMIDQTINPYKLATLEALHIQADIETLVNKRTDTQIIPHNYKRILRIFGEKRATKLN
jgi:gamma-glutamyl:cysteine ligase YbdK (ATP-grasp superfamily)